jgi:hypothetical protein
MIINSSIHGQRGRTINETTNSVPGPEANGSSSVLSDFRKKSLRYRISWSEIRMVGAGLGLFSLLFSWIVMTNTQLFAPSYDITTAAVTILHFSILNPYSMMIGLGMVAFLWGSITAIFSYYGFGIQTIGLLIFIVSIPANDTTLPDLSSYSSTTFSADIGVWVALMSTAIGAISYIVVWGHNGREKFFTQKPTD